ncbi:DUF4007 family protein [Bradyrhizobium sp. USDA 223]|uniref:DUF4007 family protein n=1 Tax=Bradyrhizobium sp. USDA 223 TaxID=3156306 RepID=UPI003837004B
MSERDYEVFSGHESFACRYGWLPKLHEALLDDPELFGDDDDAIVTLGIGKNMVRSIRFWGDAFGLTQADGKRIVPTEFGSALLDQKKGLDPYLESNASLWRLHWKITTSANLGAWTSAFLDLPDTEILKEAFLKAVQGKAVSARGTITSGTVAQHVDVFLRTYDAGRASASAVVEEGLGCPLQELGLLEVADFGANPVIRFRRGPKPDIDVATIAFAVADFWRLVAPNSLSLSFRSLMVDRRSPGTVFRLDEASMHRALEDLTGAVRGLSLREDGAGGVDLIRTQQMTLNRLEDVAWQ